jgi:uncharacterized protein (DUF2252 family)
MASTGSARDRGRRPAAPQPPSRPGSGRLGPNLPSDATEPLAPAEAAGPVERLSVEQSRALGKRARADVPRASQGGFTPATDRPDPIALLEEQAITRVPDLVPIRYGRMAASPFAFFRGAALVMATDLAATAHSGLTAQICGDAHLLNFGVFASPERRLIFDVNDFDETLPGPFEWDLKRLTASLVVASRDNGFDTTHARTAVRRAAAAYRQAMREFAGQPNLDVWYASMDADTIARAIPDENDRRRFRRAEAKAEARTSMREFRKLTTRVDGSRRFVADPPLIVPISDLAEVDHDAAITHLSTVMTGYRRTLQPDRRQILERFHLVDMARKVVGVGSVGLQAWVVLLLGRDGDDPLLLQVKQAEASVLERFLGPSREKHHGERVVNGQRLMQASSDIFLGWQRVVDPYGVQRDHYLRQLKDWKGSAEVSAMDPPRMTLYAGLCGWTLARAHARSGDRVAIASYLGKGDEFDTALVEFAEDYADQNERDHRALLTAIRTGRVHAQTGV